MRLIADHEVCEGHGMCLSLIPDLVTLGDDGRAAVTAGVPAAAEAEARLAVDSCPVQALRLVGA
ncbi:ferredoxin [Nocardia sp. alder85J]|uniref:ferredoxin n=1 Tax=Nocardia sp. alder85J TaxID=2862949 RepID=UPI001CD6DB08|nr:ferredoxin [Nocardia sp. alder85J]MCX4094209.1 ferredoxin [Nocardia sp. alder85J]